MILPQDLVDRSIYEVSSRNLIVAAYSEGWFTGIRLKFSNRYLSTELLNHFPGCGTATAISKMGELPEGILPTELIPVDNKPNVALFELLDKYEFELTGVQWEVVTDDEGQFWRQKVV